MNTAATCRQITTRAELHGVLDTFGHLVIKKRSGGRSRIHRTDCQSFRFERDMKKLHHCDSSVLGTGKAKQEYYYCKTWEDAVKTWDDVVGGLGLKPCPLCRAEPSDV